MSPTLSFHLLVPLKKVNAHPPTTPHTHTHTHTHTHIVCVCFFSVCVYVCVVVVVYPLDMSIVQWWHVCFSFSMPLLTCATITQAKVGDDAFRSPACRQVRHTHRTLTLTLTHSLTHSLNLSLNLSLAHSHSHSLIHSLTHSLTHSISYSLAHSLTHSLTHPGPDRRVPRPDRHPGGRPQLPHLLQGLRQHLPVLLPGHDPRWVLLLLLVVVVVIAWLSCGEYCAVALIAWLSCGEYCAVVVIVLAIVW